MREGIEASTRGGRRHPTSLTDLHCFSGGSAAAGTCARSCESQTKAREAVVHALRSRRTFLDAAV